MNVSQYAPDKRMEREAIGSFEALQSVAESLRAAGEAGGAGDGLPADASGAPRIERRGSCAIEGGRLEYGIDADGCATILKCESDAEALEVPGMLDGGALTAIGHHAFSTCYALRRVRVPDSVCEIGSHAFMNTGLREFEVPTGLRVIGDRAFFKCGELRSVKLNGDLREIGEGAFRESALERLDVPADVRAIGRDAFKGTPLVVVGECAALRIDPANPHIFLEGGALYEYLEAGGPSDGLSGGPLGDPSGSPSGGSSDGPSDAPAAALPAANLEGAFPAADPESALPAVGAGAARACALVQLIDDDAREFTCLPSTVRVAARAFAGKRKLERVTLLEGVTVIGEEAFKGAVALTAVDLPDSLERLGKHAFWSTSLARLRIPARLREVGLAAFYTGDTVPRKFVPSIVEVEVAPENEAFFVQEGTLCQDNGDGTCTALLHFGASQEVTIPRNVSKIGPYAYLNSPNVKQLTLYDTIGSVDVAALDFGRAVPTIVYQETGEGGKRYVVEYPPGEIGRQTMCLTFGLGRFDIDVAFAECDSAILSTREPSVRFGMMARRLADPVCMTRKMRERFRAALSANVETAVVAFGRNGYLQGVDILCDLQLVNSDNVQAAVDAAVEAGEVAVASRLMRFQRSELGRPLFDFEL